MAKTLLDLVIDVMKWVKNQRPLGIPPSVTNWTGLTSWLESESLDAETGFLSLPVADRGSMSFETFNDLAEIESAISLPELEESEG
jgi:hypothetical protein